jgi:outer membrane protein TolC
MFLLGGCMVGPKYSKPTVPIAPAFKEAPPASFKEGDGWKTAQPDDQALRGDWWTMFQDAQLNALEAQVEAANQTLRAADANYRAARAALMFARAGQKPTITTSPGIEAVRQTIGRLSDGEVIRSGPGSFSLPVDFNWEIDLWGRLRRAVASASEQAEASGADLENARLSLHAELAIDYFELRSADAQEKLLDETIKAYTRALQLTQDRSEIRRDPGAHATRYRACPEDRRRGGARAIRACHRNADREASVGTQSAGYSRDLAAAGDSRYSGRRAIPTIGAPARYRRGGAPHGLG